jgi:arylformamidase
MVADGQNPYFTDISTRTVADYSTATVTSCHISIPDHVSTHVDAPVHMVEGGATLEQVDVTALFGEAVVLDLFRGDADHAYTPKDLERATPAVEEGDIVLIYSGYRDVTTRERLRQTYLTGESAQWLVDRGVRAVGVEPAGIEHTPDALYKHGWYDPATAGPDPWPAHRTLLRNDVYIVEGLTNLDRIRGRRVGFAALPLLFPGLSGCPVRAIAWTEA